MQRFPVAAPVGPAPSRFFFIERWAARDPERRFPLIALALLVLWGLAGAVAS